MCTVGRGEFRSIFGKMNRMDVTHAAGSCRRNSECETDVWPRALFAHFKPNSTSYALTLWRNTFHRATRCSFGEMCCIHFKALRYRLLQYSPSVFSRSPADSGRIYSEVRRVKTEIPFLFLKWFSFPVKQQPISRLSPARMSNPHTWCPGYIPFEHTPFQVKLINLFITWAVSLPNHRVRNESANRTASGAFVCVGQVFLLTLLWKCIFN